MAVSTETTIQLKLSNELKRKSEDLADHKDTSLSALIRDMLKQACKREGIN